MKNIFTLKNTFYVLGLLVWYVSFSVSAHAATLYFDPGEKTVGTKGSFLVGLNVTADNSINALSLTVALPAGIEPIDISDGNSIINFWVDKPVYDASKHTISFSGIIPGGFSGKGGRLLLVRFRVLQEGDFTLTYNPLGSKIYLNTPNAIADDLSIVPLHLVAEAGKENIENDIPDTDVPESFTIFISQTPEISENKWLASFSTQDKGIGLFGFEVAESKISVTDYKTLSWSPAESPYMLKDQSRRSYLYIKAIDKKGNERIEVSNPMHPYTWAEIYLGYIIVLIICIFILSIGYILFRIRRRKIKNIQN